MSRWIRLYLWMLAVVGVWAGHLCSGHFPHWPPSICRFVSISCLGIILILLWTTPVDAIRLPRWISELVIAASTVVLLVIHPSRLESTRVGVEMGLLMLLRLSSKSPWWAVLIGWWPI